MALSLSPPVLRNVQAQFDSLNSAGERLAVDVPSKGDFSDHRYSIFHKHGGRDNHIQGIQRIGDSNHLLISGSYPYKNPSSDLFVVRFGSKADDPGPWGSNLLHARNPKSSDTLATYFKIDSEYWHPGGLSQLGWILAVPLENDPGQSRILFYDMTNPEQPKALPAATMVKRNKHKAGACALTRLPKNDTFLLAVWSDSDKKELVGDNPSYHLDFYLSNGKDIEQGFQQTPIVLTLKGEDPFHKKHQGINFLWELKDDSGEKKHTLYLVTFENTSPVQPNPVDPGENIAYLFEVTLPDDWLKEPPEQTKEIPSLKLISQKKFDNQSDWYNMDASGGIYVDSNQQLVVYSSYHFRTPLRKSFIKQKFVIKSLEFRATEFANRIDSIKDAWIELYKDHGFKDHRLAIIGPWESSIADYGKIRVNDKKFKRVKSVKFQIPDKLAYVLYRKTHFRGEQPLVLLGNGQRYELHDLKNLHFDVDVRSSQFLKAEVAKALPNPKVFPETTSNT